MSFLRGIMRIRWNWKWRKRLQVNKAKFNAEKWTSLKFYLLSNWLTQNGGDQIARQAAHVFASESKFKFMNEQSFLLVS